MTISARYEKHAIYQTEYLDQIAALIGSGNNLSKAYKTTFTVFLALRNRMDFQHAISLLNNLPLPFQAIFAHDWKVDDKVPEPLRDLNDLLLEIIQKDQEYFQLGFSDTTQAFNALKSVFKVISQHVSTQEMEAIFKLLPKDVETNLKIPGRKKYGNFPDSCIWFS